MPTLAWRTVSTVLSRMQADLDSVWDRDRLEAVSGYEADHFAELFRELVGSSPVRYHRRLRLERAAYELANSDTPAEDVGRRAGYDSPEGFSRAFRRAFGRAPREFRKVVATDGPQLPEPIPYTLLQHGGPPGLHPTPAIRYLPARPAWTLIVPSFSPLHVTAGLFRLVRGGPGFEPYTLGGLAQPWGWMPGGASPELRCLRLVPDHLRPPPAPILPITLPAAWNAIFDYEGPPAGIEAACAWMAAYWVPESGLRLAYSPVYSLTGGMPDWRGRIHARLHIGVTGLSLPEGADDALSP